LVQISNAYYALVVPGNAEECMSFFTDHGVQTSIFGDFDVLEDEESYDPYKLRVRIKEIQRGGPSKVVWESDEGAIEGRFRFEGAGIYSLCVSNDHEEEDDDIDFAFSLRLRSLRRTEDPDELPGPDDKLTSSLLEGVRSIEDNLNVLLDHQGYMREREAVHRDITESTFARVVNWTIIQVVLVFTVAGGQIWYLRKFFETKRYL